MDRISEARSSIPGSGQTKVLNRSGLGSLDSRFLFYFARVQVLKNTAPLQYESTTVPGIVVVELQSEELRGARLFSAVIIGNKGLIVDSRLDYPQFKRACGRECGRSPARK